MNEYTGFESYQPSFDLKEDKPKREYSVKESLYAWFCIIVGYLFCRTFPVWSKPLGSFIVILLVFAGSFCMLKLGGIKIKAVSILTAFSAVLLSGSTLFISNEFLQFLSFGYAVVMLFIFTYSATGNSLEQGFSNLIFADLIKAVFVLPITSFTALFHAVLSNMSQKGGKLVAKVALGIIAAVIPTVIVASLLSYDANFSEMLSGIIEFGFDDVMSHIASLFFGIPIGFYIFASYISSIDKNCNDIMSADQCRNVLAKLKIAPMVTVMAATLPILVVYAMFFFSQFEYFTNGFAGVLPENFSYANYAREGFFQLCTVSVINLIIISCISLFLKRKSEKTPAFIKLVTILYSVFTLLLIATAMAKMVLYIDCYGLTPKRVYASWFMIVLAIIFILVIVKQFVPSLKSVAVSFAVFVLAFAILCFANTDALIAKYNVDRYIDGSLTDIDAEALYKLGDSAVEHLVRLYEHEDNAYTKLCIKEYLYESKENIENSSSVFSFTLPGLGAKAALSRVLP